MVIMHQQYKVLLITYLMDFKIPSCNCVQISGTCSMFLCGKTPPIWHLCRRKQTTKNFFKYYMTQVNIPLTKWSLFFAHTFRYIYTM